jgi:D-alanine-D-alanine ligase
MKNVHILHNNLINSILSDEKESISMDKIKLAVIFGGRSTEHEVSCVSACSVLQNIDKNKYDILMIGITKTGLWHVFDGPLSDISNGSWEKPAADDMLGTAINILSKQDVVFPVLHGLYGEDGSMQGLLELLNLPYVGPGIIGSALCMDKAFSKIVFEQIGIPQAKYLVINKHDLQKNMHDTCAAIEEKFGYPCFIKPSNSGSSVGISKAHDKAELIEALKLAAKHDYKIIIEGFIDGRELECAILGNNDPIASVVGEVVPSREFYDYDSKYNDGTSNIMIPANINNEISGKVRQYAIKAFKALDCFGMSRVDFFLHKKTNQVYINEINTIPGFTSISMYPKLFEASGIKYTELLDRLIQLAMERHENF